MLTGFYRGFICLEKGLYDTLIGLPLEQPGSFTPSLEIHSCSDPLFPYQGGVSNNVL